jgi:hypothetical protein
MTLLDGSPADLLGLRQVPVRRLSAAMLPLVLKSRLLNEVTIADAGDGQSLLRLNLGVKKGAAQEIVAAIER